MGIEFHLPGTKLAKKRKRGYPRINQLDKIAKKQDIDYCLPKNLTAYWKADTKTKRKKPLAPMVASPSGTKMNLLCSALAIEAMRALADANRNSRHR